MLFLVALALGFLWNFMQKDGHSPGPPGADSRPGSGASGAASPAGGAPRDATPAQQQQLAPAPYLPFLEDPPATFEWTPRNPDDEGFRLPDGRGAKDLLGPFVNRPTKDGAGKAGDYDPAALPVSEFHLIAPEQRAEAIALSIEKRIGRSPPAATSIGATVADASQTPQAVFTSWRSGAMGLLAELTSRRAGFDQAVAAAPGANAAQKEAIATRRRALEAAITALQNGIDQGDQAFDRGAFADFLAGRLAPAGR